MLSYSTEELWFTEWEMGGPPYTNPAGLEKFNPVNFVSKWQTPMLVVHGERDFRIPLEQGIATFTALQRRGIESRLLVSRRRTIGYCNRPTQCSGTRM